MMLRLASLLAISVALPALAADDPFPADPPKNCWSCEKWNEPHEPFQLYGNSYYVGTAGLSSVLITSDSGHILIDGALPQSAPLIAENIGKLGFDLKDVKFIAISHAHYDHAGGVAALQRASGATVLAGAGDLGGLKAGNVLPHDPQVGFGVEANAYPSIASVQGVKDGEVFNVGDISLTAIATPGHTLGGTTWVWRACEAGKCHDMVYADSLTPVSADGYRYTETGMGDLLSATLKKVAALPCDILLSTHPEFVRIPEKLKARAETPQVNPFIEGGACKAYAAAAQKRLDERVERERGER